MARSEAGVLNVVILPTFLSLSMASRDERTWLPGCMSAPV